jgi:hypothetical protein
MRRLAGLSTRQRRCANPRRVELAWLRRALEPLQSDATSGDGKILTVPDPERIVRFLIRSKGPPTCGEIQIECCPMTPGSGGTGPGQMTVWRQMGAPIPVPTDIGVVAEYYAGKASGMFRARISTPVMGGAVTVWPLVGVGNTKAALEPVVR